MSVLLLILASALIHAIINLLTKQAEDKFAIRLLIGTSSAALMLPALLVLPVPQGLAANLLLVTAVVHAVYEYLLVRAYESAAFSVAYPVARGSGPLFAAFGVMFVLNQPVGGLEILGIALVCAGVVGLGWSQRKMAGAASGMAYALATGCTIGAYTLIDATGVRAVPDPFVYIAWFFVAYGAAVLTVALAVRGRAVLVAARRKIGWAPLLGTLAAASYGGALLAYRMGATARLAALRETSVLFGTGLAVLFLRERMGPRRWLAAAAIAIGAMVLAGA
jgi:drug/metabolite transporter (DMT)-like permease